MSNKNFPSDQPEKAKRFYGTYVAGTSMLIYFFTNGMALFIPPNLFPRLMEEFQATAAEVSTTVAITHLVAALLAPFVGHLVDRFGVIRTLRVGLIVMAVCFSLYPFAGSLVQLYWLHAGLGLGLILAGLLINVVLLSKWYVAKRGLAIGLLLASSSAAGFLLPPLISPLVTNPQWGWRWGFGLLAALFWLIPFILGFLVMKESPGEVGQYPDGSPRPVDKGPHLETGLTLAEAVRTRTFWCLAIGSGCLWFCINAINSQATIFFEKEAGLLPQRATFLYSLIFGFAAPGKFLFGYFSDTLAKHRVMLASSVVLLLGCLTLFEPGGTDFPFELTRNVPRLVVFTALFGLGLGGSFTMIQLVAVESFGQRARGKILGVITLVDSLAGTLGTVLISQLRTRTGTYLTPFIIVTVVAMIAVINVLLIKPVPCVNGQGEP